MRHRPLSRVIITPQAAFEQPRSSTRHVLPLLSPSSVGARLETAALLLTRGADIHQADPLGFDSLLFATYWGFTGE